MTRPAERESWLLDVVRAVLRLEDMADVEQIARQVMPILLRRCVSTCRKLVNLQDPQRDYEFVDANELSVVCIELRPGTTGIPRFVTSNRSGIPSFGIHSEEYLNRIVEDWWDSQLGVKPVAGRPDPPISPCDVLTRSKLKPDWVDNVIVIGQYEVPQASGAPAVAREPTVAERTSRPVPCNAAGASEENRPDLLFLLIRTVPPRHQSLPDGLDPCPCFRSSGSPVSAAGEPVCQVARTELYLLSKELNSLFDASPSFLRSPTRRDGDTLNQRETTEEWLQPVLERLEGLRAQLSLAEVVVRRWHLLLLRSCQQESVDARDGWIIDRQYFPDDITFNVCIPDIPRILHLAWQLRWSVGLEREQHAKKLSVEENGGTRAERLKILLVYCMLHPKRYWQPERADQEEIEDRYGPGDPDAIGEAETGDDRVHSVRNLLKKSDGAEWLRYSSSELQASSGPGTVGWPAWQNRLDRTWSGMTAMHQFGPMPFDKRAGRGDPLPQGPNRDFDEKRLPRHSVIWPVREFLGQLLGFGICCISSQSALLLGKEVDWRELDRRPVRFRWMPGEELELSFAHDVLEPEIELLSRRVFEATLGLSLATITAVRHIVCVQGRGRLPVAFADDLKEVLLQAYLHAERVPDVASEESRPARRRTGKVTEPEVLSLAAHGFGWMNRVADELQSGDVMLDFIREFGHVFGKHSVGAIHNHAGLLAASILAGAADERTRTHFKRVRDIASITARRIAAIEHVGNFYSGRMEDAESAPGSTGVVTMPELFDFFLTLPGHQMWEATRYESLDDLEDIYWSRVGLVASGIPWDPFTPLFAHVYEGLVETVLETLVHNAFKHGPIRNAGKVDPASEAELRVHVSFHRQPLEANGADGTTSEEVSAVAIWGTGSGFKGTLCKYMIGEATDWPKGQESFALPVDLFRNKRVGGAGHDEHEGIGLRVLLHCLEMQEKELKSQKKEQRALRLFLLHRRAVEDATYLGAAADVHPELLAAARAVREVWGMDGIGKPGSHVMEVPGVFILTQTSEGDGRGHLAGSMPPEPKDGYSVAVLDLTPSEADLRAYDLLGAKPEADYLAVLQRPELPHAVVCHTAWAELSETYLERWLTQAGDVYRKRRGHPPLIWLISASERLRALAVRHGAWVTDHGEFSDWCAARARRGQSPVAAHRGLRRELVRWLGGVGRAEFCVNTWADATEALCCSTEEGGTFPLGDRTVRWMDSPRAAIEPAAAWWMRRGMDRIGCWAGTKRWAESLRMRLKTDSESIAAVYKGQL